MSDRDKDHVRSLLTCQLTGGQRCFEAIKAGSFGLLFHARILQMCLVIVHCCWPHILHVYGSQKPLPVPKAQQTRNLGSCSPDALSICVFTLKKASCSIPLLCLQTHPGTEGLTDRSHCPPRSLSSYVCLLHLYRTSVQDLLSSTW